MSDRCVVRVGGMQVRVNSSEDDSEEMAACAAAAARYFPRGDFVNVVKKKVVVEHPNGQKEEFVKETRVEVNRSNDDDSCTIL